MNKWEQIAKIVGEENGIELKLGEEFEIEGQCFHPYVFTSVGLYNKEGEDISLHLSKLINGSYKIKKIPRKPQKSERYWVPEFMEDSLAEFYTWTDGKADNNFFKNRLVCSTKEEAIALAKKMLEVTKGDNVSNTR